jgi:hypothetical protein
MSYSELSVKKVSKNRKNYACVWCGQLSLIGESSISRAYVLDGDLSRDRWHLECWEAAGKTQNDLEDGWFPGDYPRGGSIAFAEMSANV